VAFGQRAGVDQVDRLVWQVQQPDRVSQVGAASTQPRREPTRGQVQVVEQ
jgi:hypothetical protein